MELQTPAADQQSLTVPELSLRLGLTVWQLDSLIGRRPDLAHLIFRAGGRRMTAASNLGIFRSAVTESSTRPDAPANLEMQ